ncbi:hypothetical protein [Bacillus fonticola]|uniref:hypothetical protein n=1 Tax=Bacillus fonticola TaxID=2728853 RepID=UPI0014759F8B|nr:hypothetical protein [Bacillus fonticola]
MSEEMQQVKQAIRELSSLVSQGFADVNKRFIDMEERMDERFVQMEKRTDERFEEVIKRLDRDEEDKKFLYNTVAKHDLQLQQLSEKLHNLTS